MDQAGSVLRLVDLFGIIGIRPLDSVTRYLDTGQ